MTALEERQLAGGAIAGDADAVQALWHAHRRWVAAILLAHKPRDAEIDDLLQEVAVLLVKNIRTLNDPAAVKPWLRTIAINLARSSGRRTRVARKVMPVVAAEARRATDRRESESAPPRRSDRGALALELAQTLPMDYREPLLLRAVRGLSYRQIADVMGVPMTTIETRIARARRMLKDEMDKIDTHPPARHAERGREPTP
jgi:RNA polymerase sigma-70 factor (ECF subfamily)